MPAEWESHRATWLCWPHHELDWPGKLQAVRWAYADIVRILANHETTHVLCHDTAVRAAATAALAAHGVNTDTVHLHTQETDRAWLRDLSPTGVITDTGDVEWVHWAFNGWAKYDNWRRDAQVGHQVAAFSGLPRRQPLRRDTGTPVVLEGGGIDVNGRGLLLVTEEWLLSDVQVRNPGLTREGYEQIFTEWLGVRRTIWLGDGCVGDDTHGHVDDVVRFVSPDTVVIAEEPDPRDDNHLRAVDNRRRLELATQDPTVGPLRIVSLPFPRAVTMDGDRLPASYANFYIANGVVLVPTFNDPRDRAALNTLAELFPDRKVVGVHALDLVWGLGTLHCLTQQEPLSASVSG